MTDHPINIRLRATADKLRQMWGRNPDADLLVEAAVWIETKLAEEEKAKTSKTKGTSK